jgi:hypothetical protein
MLNLKKAISKILIIVMFISAMPGVNQTAWGI